MKMRAPSVPIITIDPYISIWSPADKLNDCDTVHWTNKEMPIRAYIIVDGETYIFSGVDSTVKKAKQINSEITAMSSSFVFNAGNVELTAVFTAPMFLDDYDLLSRPLNYLKVNTRITDGKKHSISIKISVAEEICQYKRRQADLIIEQKTIDNISIISMKSEQQPVLLRFGDDIRIDWGCFFLSCEGGATSYGRVYDRDAMTMYVNIEKDISDGSGLFSFAYDDYKSIDYFHDKLSSYWNKDGVKIEEVILEAHKDYNLIREKADEFDKRLINEASECGGEKYAELLSLAYRQVLAAHKLVVDKDGELLYISKECFSNGCAATTDVSYPSIPLFLIYNPELIKGMMRPIFKYAKMKEWPHEFAPHDVGTYPVLWGQTYGGTIEDVQMPIEECGNMVIMAAALCIAEHNFEFAKSEISLLKQWTDYLVKYGADPENQLCSDDFAGHSAHNCNLSVKAILAIEAMAIICKNLDIENEYDETARQMASLWEERAVKEDKSYKLAFDSENSFSMKYNIVWDKLFNSKVFSDKVAENEVKSYINKINPYGIPLDSRETYTKSDWLVWSATLAKNKEDFQLIIDKLWNAYNYSKSRVPMTDFYDTITAEQHAFQHRSVQGGLFIKLLETKGMLAE